MSRPALDDNVPAILEMLLARLARHPADEWGERVGRELGGSGVGVEHARQRLAERYSLVEALRELSHLRAAMIDLCHRHAITITVDEAELLHATIDELMRTAAGELEAASLRKHEEAMAVVAHDLGGPLNVVTLWATRLARGRVDDARRCGTTLTRSAQRMTRLINDLLTLSKVEAGHFALDVKEYDVRWMVREAAEQFRETADRGGVGLNVQVPAWPVLLECDSGRLVQAIGNLVSNGVKYSPPGGHVDVSLDAEPDECVVRVRDTGAGIAAEHSDEVFRMFWQAPERARAGGVGLGLAIARTIVRAHAGTIAVTSEPGAGAELTITLPRGPARGFALGAVQRIEATGGPSDGRRTTAPH
jgi:signal transduction histidine kinase